MLVVRTPAQRSIDENGTARLQRPVRELQMVVNRCEEGIDGRPHHTACVSAPLLAGTAKPTMAKAPTVGRYVLN
jgi:hypothetical protein